MPSGTTTFGAFFGALACALLVGGASAGGEGAAAAGTPGAPNRRFKQLDRDKMDGQ